MPIFRVKSVKIYTGQKNLHEYVRGVRDKYEVYVREPQGSGEIISMHKKDSENIVSWQEENNLRSRRGIATTMLNKISGIALDADRQQKNNKILDVKCVRVNKAVLKQQNGI